MFSATHQGIANAPRKDADRNLFSFEIGMSILWTFLPALLFQAYGFAYAAIVKAACARQPFVELLKNEEDGAAPEKSILLDYSSWILPVAIFKALKLGHFMLFWAQLVSLITQLVLGPIGSHLFDTKPILRQQSIGIVQDSVFDDSAFDAVAGLSNVLDIVSASKLYEAPPLPWITDDASLLPFRLAQPLPPTQVANACVQTQAYSLGLDCRTLSPPAFRLVHNASEGIWHFGASDRNCDFGTDAGILFVSDNTGAVSSIAQTYRASCDHDAGTSRIIVVAALRDSASANGFSNVSVVSCIPSYQSIDGEADVTYTGASGMVLQSYTAKNRTTLSNTLFGPSFENQVVQTSITGSGTEFSTKAGSDILQLAKKQTPTTYVNDAEVFTNATKTILTSAFNNMVQTFLVQPGGPKQLTGSISRSQSRLIVVLPVAYTILGVLTAVWLALIWIYHYTHRYREAQFEESKGLVGPAVLLCNSALNAEVARRKPLTMDGRIGEGMAYDFRHSKRVGWKIEHWPYPRRTVLVSTPKARHVSWFRWREWKERVRDALFD